MRTLEDIEKANPECKAQVILDYVAESLFRQGERSINIKNCGCAYRSGRLKCAAGFLIKDGVYQPDIEGLTVKDASAKECLIPEAKSHIELVGKLQSLHDEPANWSSSNRMVAELSRVAERFKLSDANIKNMRFADR